VVEAIIVVAGANYSIARYASNLQMQILSLRSLLAENQLLHCFMAQLELQQSRSLAQELQLPALIWAQLIYDTQELLPLGPGLKEEVELEGDKEGMEVEGQGEEVEEYTRPSKDSWCAELEACFREAAGHGGRGWGCQGRWNGEGKGGGMCECTGNTNLAVRKLVALRWARVRRQLQHERERVRKAEVMQLKMREKKLLLARIQNGEMSL
jgi:hypothetical protein